MAQAAGLTVGDVSADFSLFMGAVIDDRAQEAFAPSPRLNCRERPRRTAKLSQSSPRTDMPFRTRVVLWDLLSPPQVKIGPG